MGKKGTSRYKNILGEKYNFLTVVEFSHTNKQNAFWKCKCDCGNEKIISSNCLRTNSVKSCGKCDIRKKPDEDSPIKRHFRSLKNGALTRNLLFEIDFEEYKKISEKNCAYCGEIPTDKHFLYSRRRYSKGVDHDFYSIFNSLDRINSSLGYVKDNVVPCCSMCNRLKSDFTKEQFLDKIKNIYEYNYGDCDAKISDCKKN